MYAFESSPRRGIFHVLVVACFVLALLLFGISGTEGMAYPMVYQFSGVVLLVAGIFFLSRYILKQYRYEISESTICDATGKPLLDLVITETSGRRITVVARVALRDVVAVEVVNKTEDAARAKEKVSLLRRGVNGEKPIVFRYTNTPFVTQACYISVPAERSVLVIPPDKTMVDILRQGMGGQDTERF